MRAIECFYEAVLLFFLFLFLSVVAVFFGSRLFLFEMNEDEREHKQADHHRQGARVVWERACDEAFVLGVF